MKNMSKCLVAVSAAVMFGGSLPAAAPLNEDVIVYIDGSMENGAVKNLSISSQALSAEMADIGNGKYSIVESDLPAARLVNGVADDEGYDNGIALSASPTKDQGACVSFSDSSPSYTQTDFTCEMFIKASKPDWQKYVFSHPNGWRLYMNNGGKLDLINGNWSKTLITTGYIADESWHHVAVVYDADAREIAVYVDYSLVDRVSYTMGTAPNTNFGLYGGLVGAAYDEVRITRRVLCPAQFIRDPSKRIEGIDMARVAKMTDEDTVIYASFSPDPAQSWRNELKLLDPSKPELTASYQYIPPEYIEPDGLTQIFPASYADAAATMNTKAFHAYARQGETQSMRLTSALAPSFSHNDFTMEFFFKGDRNTIYPDNRDTIYLLTAPGRFHVVYKGDHLKFWKSDWTDACQKHGVIDGGWHHLAVTWQQSSRTLRFYVDGVELGSQVRAEDFSALTSADIGIGCFPGGLGDNNFGDMTIDEVRLTARCLEPDEMLATSRKPFYRKAVAALTFESSVAHNLVADGMVVTVANNKTSELVSADLAPETGYVCGNSGLRADSAKCYHVAKSEPENNWNGGGLKLTDAEPALRSDSFTVETFIKIGKLSPTLDSYVFSQPGAWDLYIEAATHKLKASAGASVFATSSKRVSMNRYHHLAYVYDADAGTCTAYLDYNPVGTVSGVTDLAEPGAAVGGHIYFGGKSEWSWGLINCFAEAWFDELRITRKALCPAEFLKIDLNLTPGLHIIIR